MKEVREGGSVRMGGTHCHANTGCCCFSIPSSAIPSPHPHPHQVPADVGNKFGEPIYQDRGIRINRYTHLTLDRRTCNLHMHTYRPCQALQITPSDCIILSLVMCSFASFPLVCCQFYTSLLLLSCLLFCLFCSCFFFFSSCFFFC